MSLHIHYVETDHTNQVWPQVERFIKDALEQGLSTGSGNYTYQHVRQYVTSGQWLLLVAVDEDNVVHGAATVSFINYPLHRVAFLTTMGGKFITNRETFRELASMMKQNGATKIQGLVRPSMLRLSTRYGFTAGNTLTEVLI